MDTFALIVASLFFAAGVVGSFAPVLPGAPLIWAGMLIFGFMTGFEKLDWLFFLLQGLLTVAVFSVDYLATALGTRYFGSTKAAALGALCGLIAGVFFFPMGLIIGPFAGAMLFELIATQNPETALRSGVGALLGFWGGAVVKLALETGMITWFFLKTL